MTHLFQTLRFSLRQSLKAPANAILCIMVLAGAIAIVMAMMRICQMVFFSSLPYDESDRMYTVMRQNAQGDRSESWPLETFKIFEAGQDVFSDLLVSFQDGTSIRAGGSSEAGRAVRIAYVSTDFSEVIGIPPIAGRSFSKDDLKGDAPKVAMIGEGLWNELFGARLDAIGSTIEVDGVVRTLVGIMPAGFDGPFPAGAIQVWIPLNLDTLKQDSGWGNIVSVVGKLKDGLDDDCAAPRLDTLLQRLISELPDENQSLVSIPIDPINRARTDGTGRIIFPLLLGCSILVLLMACAIVSGLMTARYSSRTQEIAIRVAHGASRMQIVSQMLGEFLLVSGTATILGLLLYRLFGTTVLAGYLDQFNLPSFMVAEKPMMTVVFAPVILGLVTLTSVLVPALRASRVDISNVLRESTRTGSSLRATKMSNFIITWQIATACMVLGGCAVMGYYLYAFNNQNEYYDRAQYTGVNFTFSPKAHPEPAIRAALARRIVQELEQDPSIDNVALTNEYYNSTSGDSRAWIEGVDYASENDVPLVCRRIVSPGYFAATNIPILIGRGFDDNDGLEHPVAVVTEEFARRYYGSTDALGCRFRFGRDWQQYTIVGIVPDVFRNRFFPDRPTGVFVPYACENWMDMILIAKTGNLSAADAERRITEILGSLDPRLSIAQVTPLDHMHSLYQGGTIISFVFMLFSVCGVAALIMAAAGLFGIISFQVNIRRLEIGIRMALGESPSGAVMLIMRRGLMCVTAGLLLGSVGTYLIRYIIASSDAEMPENPWLYVAGLAIMLSISLASMFLPAAKAASEDPCKALHEN